MVWHVIRRGQWSTNYEISILSDLPVCNAVSYTTASRPSPWRPWAMATRGLSHASKIQVCHLHLFCRDEEEEEYIAGRPWTSGASRHRQSRWRCINMRSAATPFNAAMNRNINRRRGARWIPRSKTDYDFGVRDALALNVWLKSILSEISPPALCRVTRVRMKLSKVFNVE